MTDDVKRPEAQVILRVVPSIGKELGGLPTAMSRIDITKSTPHIVPAIVEDASAAERELPKFEPKSEAWLDRHPRVAGSLLTLMLLVASILVGYAVLRVLG